MRDELAAILADPAFARSPVAARLLTYLVDETLAGRGAALKSYTVGVEGLGRGPEYEPQVDAYARVAVGRLRRSLDAYYAADGRSHAKRLMIGSGSYEVSLVDNALNSPPREEPRQQPPRPAQRPRPRRLGWTIAAGIVALVAGVVLWRVATDAAADKQRWLDSDFPTIGVSLSGAGEVAAGGYDTVRLRAMLLGQLAGYPSVRPVTADDRDPDYAAEVYQSTDPDGTGLAISLIDNATRRIVWSETYPLSVPTRGEDRTKALAEQIAFRIANIMGLVNQNEIKKNRRIDSPYGCWLRFAWKVRTEFSTSDDALNRCAKDWYGANPQGPLAAGTYGWSLVDQSIYRLTESGRREDLDEAIRVLELSKRVFPESGFLLVSTARAYAFNGDVRNMLLIYPQALSSSPGNQDVEGAVGTMLSLRNVREGEDLIDAALQHNPSPPPWYYIGKFISAMMRDDPAAASTAVEEARRIDRSLSLLPLLDAAVKARTGHLDEARSAWAEAIVAVPVLQMKRDLFFSRMPLSPEVRVRLQRWLAPALE